MEFSFKCQSHSLQAVEVSEVIQAADAWKRFQSGGFAHPLPVTSNVLQLAPACRVLLQRCSPDVWHQRNTVLLKPPSAQFACLMCPGPSSTTAVYKLAHLGDSPIRTRLHFLHNEKRADSAWWNEWTFPTTDDCARGNIYSPISCIAPKSDRKNITFPRSTLFGERRSCFGILTISRFFPVCNVNWIIDGDRHCRSITSCMFSDITLCYFQCECKTKYQKHSFFSRWYYFSSQ